MSFRSTFPTTPLARLAGHNGPVHALTYSSGSGQYILTGSQDRCVRLFNPASKASQPLIQTYKAHGYEVLDIACAADNRTFVSVGGDKLVFLWDVETAQAVRRFSGHTARVNTCAFGGVSDSVIVTGSYDGTVKVWDIRARADHRPIMSLAEAKDAISHVRVHGHEIYAASVDGRVRRYDLASGEVETDVVAPGHGVTSLIVAAAGDGYLATCLQSKVRFMDRASGRCLQTFSHTGAFVNENYRIRAALAMGDAVVICGSENGQIVVWDLLTGQMLHSLRHRQEHKNAANPTVTGTKAGQVPSTTTKQDVVSAVAWNQMRKKWASAGGDGTVIVWGTDMD